MIGWLRNPLDVQIVFNSKIVMHNTSTKQRPGSVAGSEVPTMKDLAEERVLGWEYRIWLRREYRQVMYYLSHPLYKTPDKVKSSFSNELVSPPPGGHPCQLTLNFSTHLPPTGLWSLNWSKFKISFCSRVMFVFTHDALLGVYPSSPDFNIGFTNDS